RVSRGVPWGQTAASSASSSALSSGGAMHAKNGFLMPVRGRGSKSVRVAPKLHVVKRVLAWFAELSARLYDLSASRREVLLFWSRWLKWTAFGPFFQSVKVAVAPGVGTTIVESVVPVKAADDLRELIGKRIGNYVIERTLGRGGMAVVFLAKHPTLRREVAIKVLKPSLHGDSEMAGHFMQEAKVTATLSHPNVVEILDFGELERRPYYMMELLQGEDLRTKLSDHRQWPYREVVGYVEQICEALEAAHKVGVVHRDLKPENIFVLGQEPLKLKVMGF